MQDMKELADQTRQTLQQIGKQYPDMMKGFQALVKSSQAGTAIDQKTAELIAIAISVIKECSYCITLHVKKALDVGCTRDQIMEACFVAVLMGGGPAMMYTTEVWRAINDFSD